ncbi:hypothetical protein [Methylibium sp. Root1272]|uniref:hypothetical protein n=1 Tax=Methylibium sp. Root1272 TaxID=1736441 RepID=UPI00138F152E|nr:hypothetical protein [Methylibium sp. Root1272]
MKRTEANPLVQRRRFLVWALVLFVVVGTLASYKPISHFVAVDRCLDSGGRWNYEAEECER